MNEIKKELGWDDLHAEAKKEIENLLSRFVIVAEKWNLEIEVSIFNTRDYKIAEA